MTKQDDDFPAGPTSEFERLLQKALEISKVHQKAQTAGVKLGTLQDFGIFLGPEAPDSLRFKKFPMFTMTEFESMTRRVHDRVISKGIFRYLPPGGGIAYFYNGREHLLAEATPQEMAELWDDFFRDYPEPHRIPWSATFREAIDAELHRRASNDGTTTDPMNTRRHYHE